MEYNNIHAVYFDQDGIVIGSRIKIRMWKPTVYHCNKEDVNYALPQYKNIVDYDRIYKRP